MNANPGGRERGRGETPLTGSGESTRPAVDDARLSELEGMSAREAIESLEGVESPDKLDLDPGGFPGPKAEAFYWDDATINLIMGPVGSGKTTTKYKSRLRRAMAMPRSVIDGVRRYKLLVTRETYRQLWSTTIPDFLGVYPKSLGDWSGGRGSPVKFEMRFEDEHGPIEFTAEFMAFGDDVQAAMRGYQATDIDLHETDTNPLDVMLNGITRINRFPGKAHFAGYPPEFLDYGQIVGDFNAPDPDNWVCKLFLDDGKREALLKDLNAQLQADTPGAKPIRISYYRQPGYGEKDCENLWRLGPSYYPTMIATQKLLGRGDTIDRLVRNKIVYTRAGQPVFEKEFNPRIHVASETLTPWPDAPLVIGLDQGLKGAAVIGQRRVEGSGKWRRVFWRILAELHFPDERLLARVFGVRLADLLATPRFAALRVEGGWADMAGEHGQSAAAEENQTWNLLVGRAAEFKVRPQRIGTNRLQPRLEAVRATLEAPVHAGEPGLLIDPGCKLLIAGFEARYVWTDEITPSGDKRKVPDKRLTEANVMDALQYLLLSEHRGDGLSPQSFPETRPGRGPGVGHNGGPPLGEVSGGLRTDYDLLNPYGD